MCIVCVYMLGKFQDERTMSGIEYKLGLSCAVHTCVTECKWRKKRYISKCHWGNPSELMSYVKVEVAVLGSCP